MNSIPKLTLDNHELCELKNIGNNKKNNHKNQNSKADP